MTELSYFERQINARLEPGDVILYSGKSLLARLIKIKTFSRFSHIEFYAGRGVCYASRLKGVNTYSFTSKDLACILRPIDDGYGLDQYDVIPFHSSCIGQAYDTLGLFRFFTLGKQSKDKQFCSEYVTRLCRKLRVKSLYSYTHFQPFSEYYDADLVSPGMFFSSPHFKEVWDIKEEEKENQDKENSSETINF